MRRSIAIIAVVLLFAAPGGGAALASTCEVDAGGERSGLESRLVVDGECLSHSPGRLPGPRSGAGAYPQPVVDGPVLEYAYEPMWGSHPDTGELCVDLLRSDSVTTDSPLGQIWEERALEMIADPLLVDVEYRWCDDTSNVAVAADPTADARDFVRSIPLPAVEIAIAPGFAITGQPSYLVVDGQEPFEAVGGIPGFGPLEATLEPVAIRVDWGDGTTDLITDGRMGVPWDGPPSERIAHTYIHAAPDLTVTVEVLWRAEWSVGVFSGTVSDLEVLAELDLEVRSLRSVRVAPER